MKLKKAPEKKQIKTEKPNWSIEEGTNARLAELRSEVEAKGYIWEFEKLHARWLKNFISQLEKAIDARNGQTKMGESAVKQKNNVTDHSAVMPTPQGHTTKAADFMQG
jgi:hypothetical protein